MVYRRIYKNKAGEEYEGKVWWTSFTSPSGEQIRRSTGTTEKAKAQQLEDKLKNDLWEEVMFGKLPNRTWTQAVVKWSEGKDVSDDDKRALRWLDPHLGGVNLRDVNNDLISKIRKAKMDEKVTNATVNRTLEVVRKILRKACISWLWIASMPEIEMLNEPPIRIRWLSKEEAKRLILELDKTAPHVAEMVRFTLATGLRESNVTGLEWSQVDLKRRRAWIHPDQSKSKKAIAVPLNNAAMVVLNRQAGKDKKWVFTYKGKRVTRANNHAWRKALKRAEIENFRWHDLRHTWASWHVQNGTPLYRLKELGGWATMDMVMRYAHLGEEHLAAFADNVGELD